MNDVSVVVQLRPDIAALARLISVVHQRKMPVVSLTYATADASAEAVVVLAASPGAVGQHCRHLGRLVDVLSVEVETPHRATTSMALDAADVERVAHRVAALEAAGWDFATAQASYELLLRDELGLPARHVEVESWRVIVESHRDGTEVAEATIKLVAGGERVIATAEGNGPVHALDRALHRALEGSHPGLAALRLVDYNVTVLDATDGTGATVRVVVTSTDGEQTWRTMAAGANVLDASLRALLDAVDASLLDHPCEHLPAQGMIGVGTDARG